MRRALLLALLLTACAPEPEQALPVSQDAPPPAGTAVLFADTMTAGAAMSFGVWTDPGRPVRFYASLGGPGAGSCPPAHGGTCLGIVGGPVVLGDATADGRGWATVRVNVPVTLSAPTAWFQAVVVRAGADQATNVVERQVLRPVTQDGDADGLPDVVEGGLGTNPSDPDSDGDSLLDGAEVLVYGTDPLRVDTDADTLTDAEEVLIHYTDPHSADGDHDDLTDPEEVLTTHTDPHLADTDGDGLSDSRELRTHRTDPRVADMDEDGLLDGGEIAAGSDPREPDTDGDGLLDGDEAASGASPIDADSDDDGLTDGDEVHLWTTDPTRLDTDGDLLWDGEELAHGDDPRSAGSPGMIVYPLRLVVTWRPTAAEVYAVGDEIDVDIALSPGLAAFVPQPNEAVYDSFNDYGVSRLRFADPYGVHWAMSDGGCVVDVMNDLRWAPADPPWDSVSISCSFTVGGESVSAELLMADYTGAGAVIGSTALPPANVLSLPWPTATSGLYRTESGEFLRYETALR